MWPHCSGLNITSCTVLITQGGDGLDMLYTSVAMATVGGLTHIFAHLLFCFCSLCLQIVFGFCYNLLGLAAILALPTPI